MEQKSPIGEFYFLSSEMLRMEAGGHGTALIAGRYLESLIFGLHTSRSESWLFHYKI